MIFDPFKTAGAAGSGVLQTISQVYKLFARADAAGQQQSLAEFSSAARVEPLTIVSNDCVHMEELPLVLQTVNSLFTAHYLQAVSLIGTVDKVSVIKILDKLNPNRSGASVSDIYEATGGVFSKEGWKNASEAYKYRLPTASNKLAMESEKDRINSEPATGVDVKSDSKGGFASVSEITNLCVGKMINVDININGQKASFPISIRLMVNQIPDSSLEYLLSLPNHNKGMVERYHDWRSGRISFVSDLILCQDLIDAHKKALMKDTNGVYSEIIARANNHKSSSFISGSPSLASASNIFIISDAVAAGTEERLGGKLKDPHVRDKLFSTGYGMILVVLDKKYERATFYTRGIAAGTSLGFRDLKAASKGTGPDITEIFKAYSLGNQASF